MREEEAQRELFAAYPLTNGLSSGKVISSISKEKLPRKRLKQ